MQTFHSHLLFLFQEWLISIGVLIATIVVAGSSRAALKSINKDQSWPLLRQMAPALSNVSYVIGLKIFSDVVPLNERSATWVDGIIYILSIIIYLDIFQKAALIGIEWSASKSAPSKALEQGFIPLMRNVTTLFVFFSGVIMTLKHFNYDVMSLVTALGVSSLAVGLAAKDTLSNMISGFILIIDRNLRPSDRINLNGMVWGCSRNWPPKHSY